MDNFDPMGFWAAGLVDGEGCFAIGISRKGKYLHICFTFSIGLRIDDRPTLEKLQKTLGGIGRFYTHTSSKSPGVYFKVAKTDGLLLIIDFFEKYPLQSKKQGDFKIWAEAFRYYLTGRYKGFSPEHMFLEMEKRAQQLQDNRRYVKSATTA